jgi:hypothetical protein
VLFEDLPSVDAGSVCGRFRVSRANHAVEVTPLDPQSGRYWEISDREIIDIHRGCGIEMSENVHLLPGSLAAVVNDAEGFVTVHTKEDAPYTFMCGFRGLEAQDIYETSEFGKFAVKLNLLSERQLTKFRKTKKLNILPFFEDNATDEMTISFKGDNISKAEGVVETPVREFELVHVDEDEYLWVNLEI